VSHLQNRSKDLDQLPVDHSFVALRQARLLSALPCLLGADHRNDSAQLGRLGRVLLDDRLFHSLRFRELGGCCEHAVLELQHLLKGVVEERSGESDRLSATTGGKAHLEFARSLAPAFGDVLHLLLHLGSLATVNVSSRAQNVCSEFCLPFDECYALGHLCDSVGDS
jgi:hypothetical protein